MERLWSALISTERRPGVVGCCWWTELGVGVEDQVVGHILELEDFIFLYFRCSTQRSLLLVVSRHRQQKRKQKLDGTGQD